MSHWLRLAGLMAMVSASSGCASWQAQGFEPGVVIEREHPDRLRLTRTDSSRTELQHPRVNGDTLVGLSESRSFAVPLDSVAYVELRRSDPTLLYVGVGLGVAAGIVALLAATWD